MSLNELSDSPHQRSDFFGNIGFAHCFCQPNSVFRLGVLQTKMRKDSADDFFSGSPPQTLRWILPDFADKLSFTLDCPREIKRLQVLFQSGFSTFLVICASCGSSA